MAHTISSPSSFLIRYPRDTRLRDLIAAWRRRSAEKAELSQFSARDLHDVGLTAADQQAILDTPLWRDAADPRR